jgi:ATP-binding cassette, subfamily B, bacterial PglK
MLLDIMDAGERRRFWIVVAITFVLAAIEAASLLTILPFLMLIAEPSLITTNSALAWTYARFGFESEQEFLVAVGFTVFLLTVVGLCLKMVSIWLTTRFALMRSFTFSARLLFGYLHQPYEWFLSRHSSEMGNAILSEVDKVVRDSLLPAMRMIPEAFTVAVLLFALCILEPVIALGSAAVIGGAYLVIYLAVQKMLVRLSGVRLEANRTRFHVVQEATGGAKLLKTLGLEDSYINRFRVAALRLAQVETRGQVLSHTPRHALEAVAFGGMILLVLVLLFQRGGDVAALVPTLGIIAAAGLRLIPALQQLYQRGTTVRQAEANLAHVHRDIVSLREEAETQRRQRGTLQPDRPLRTLLELKDVHYGYPTADKQALRGLDLAIPANSTIGIVGGTGAGKTTVVDIILGLLIPTEGQMIVDGVPITVENRRGWQKTLGYVPQSIFLSDVTIAENIAFGLPTDQIDREAVERAARIAALHDFVMSELPNGYDTHVGERGVRLSGGQIQRIGIARALYHDPAMLILDEATSALDVLTERAVMDAVHNIVGEKTIVMIAHRLSTVRECDRIFLLRNGRVAASGRFDELRESDEQFRQMAAGL